MLLCSLLNLDISIHAAREGGDLTDLHSVRRKLAFQSTPPVKAATSSGMSFPNKCNISIHAAREGGDALARDSYIFSIRISIHAAREGGDYLAHAVINAAIDFNPRRP